VFHVTGARFLRTAWAIARKDFRIEARGKQALPMAVALSLLVVVVFAFAGEGPTGSGPLWVAFVFAGTVGVMQSVAVEGENDAIDARGLFTAYREHRQAHFEWGDDPRDHGDRYGDPYLGNYYDTARDATYEPDDDEPAGDPDEVVGHVYDVDIRYEAVVRGRVVAPDKQRAKEKLKDLRLADGEDLNGDVPTANLTMELHGDTTERDAVHRADSDLAERMEGWPW